MAAGPWVRVAVALPLAAPLTYEAPAGLGTRLRPGHAVLVPLGGRLVNGWVIEEIDAPDLPEERIRPVARLLDPEPVFDPSRLEFLAWAARYYMSSLGEMLATAMPAATRARTRRVFLPRPSAADALASESLDGRLSLILREIVRRPGRPMAALSRQLGEEIEQGDLERGLELLRKRGLVAREDREVGHRPDGVPRVRLAVGLDDERLLLPKGGPRMREVLAVLAESDGEMDLSALLERCGPSARGSIQRMASLGLLSLGRSEKAEPPVAELGGASRQPLALNGAQSAAIDAIFSREPAVWLLHGVTGSGKTEVYLRCAARVIEEGRQVLVLVPEIALTPQLLGRFRARFGDTVAVLHSGLTGPERLASWRRIHAGERMVALGARSALFAPFRRLGLIVVDEEHDESYKQDEGVRYHARDLAVVRGRGAGCPVILGSATPSIESLRNASEGRYQLLSLPERATPCAPARIEIIDMSHEPRGAEGLPPLLSGALRAALRETLDAGAKAIVLYNRRGFATTVSCKACGGSYICPSCGISLVLHKSLGRVTCHYCGFSVPFSPTCPKCGSPEIELLGQGSERVAEHLCEAFPEVPVLRMDADTTGERGAHARILEDFRSRETGILVGTQLVAKGHDFPDVLLAAVVGVDHLLSLPDFRAAERTWALVTQLAGRAGRGDRAGRVLLQTHHPDHFVFRSLGDAPAFLAEETRHRGILAYPPFTRLVLIRVEGTDPARVQEAVHALARSLRQDRPPGRVVDVLGPTPAPIARMVGRWRYQVLLRGRRYAPFRAWIEEALPRARAALPHGVRCVVDVDPRDLM